MTMLAAGDTTQAMAVAVIGAGSIVVLLLLRSAGFPPSGRALVAGAVAGVLIGPMVLSRVLPERYESMFVGGVKQREALDYARWFNINAPLAMKNISEESRQAQRVQGQSEIAERELALQHARWRHQQPLRVFSMIVVSLAMLMSATHSVRSGDRRQGWVTPASIGLWSFALPAALAYMIAMRWWDVDRAEAAVLAAAVGIGPWALGIIDRPVADDAEFGGARMMQTAGRLASTLAIALTLWAAWRVRGREGPWLMAPLLTLPLAWLLDFLPRRSKASPTLDASASLRPFAASSVALIMIEGVMSILSALVAIRIDLFQHVAFWPLIVLALLADDGRWLGAFLGAMLPGGRPALRSMRLVMPAMAAGPTQVAVAALALCGGFIDERFALPLLAGAILIETTAPARRGMAARLIETEEEFANDDEE